MFEFFPAKVREAEINADMRTMLQEDEKSGASRASLTRSGSFPRGLFQLAAVIAHCHAKSSLFVSGACPTTP